MHNRKAKGNALDDTNSGSEHGEEELPRLDLHGSNVNKCQYIDRDRMKCPAGAGATDLFPETRFVYRSAINENFRGCDIERVFLERLFAFRVHRQSRFRATGLGEQEVEEAQGRHASNEGDRHLELEWRQHLEGHER